MSYWRAELREWLAGAGGATPAERLVFVALALHANGDRTAFPGAAALVVETGLSRSTVFAALRELGAHGAITVEARSGRPSAYHLTLTRPDGGPVQLPDPSSRGAKPVRLRGKTRPAPGPVGIEGIEGTPGAENGAPDTALPVEIVELGRNGVDSVRDAIMSSRRSR